MAYVTPTSKTTGDLIAATDWNQNTVDNPIALRTGGIAIASQATGDLIVASTASQLSRVAGVAVGQVLVSGGVGVAPAYTDSPSISGALSVSGNATISGTAIIQQTYEKTTISATAATGTIQYDSLTQAVLYYTSNASANWTLNVRGSSTVSLNSVLSTGQSVTVAFLVTQGSTAYYPTALTIDGNSVSPKWQGGSAPTAGNASSVDAYVYSIVKTGSAAFTVFASQTRFA